MSQQIDAHVPTFAELRAQVDALPENLTGEILHRDRISTMSRPGKAHRRALQVLFDGLRGQDAGRVGTGWWLEIDAELLFRHAPGFRRLVVPDLSGWRVDRVPDLPDENPLTLVPDWVCEVLSPSTSRKDRSLKLPLYAAVGVRHVWMVSPEDKLVEVYDNVSGNPTLVMTAGDETEGRVPPFADMAIDFGMLWLPSAATTEVVPDEG